MREHNVRGQVAGVRLLAMATVAVALGALLSGPFADQPGTVGDVPTWDSYCGNGIAEPGEECDPGTSSQGIDPDLRQLTCESKGFTGGGLACTPQCKVDDSGCFCDGETSLPATGQTTCCHSGDDGDIRAGAPLSYTDNGDATITDDNTGLMWERKDDSGGIHDKDTRYVWDDAFSVFIDALNNTCEGDGVVRCDNDDLCGAGGQCGFAGYRDWRMPNVKELQSIVNYQALSAEFSTNCVSGCTLLQCSCTVPSIYWSSSSSTDYSDFAWIVYFGSGRVFNIYNKFTGIYVRAVRGGS